MLEILSGSIIPAMLLQNAKAYSPIVPQMLSVLSNLSVLMFGAVSFEFAGLNIYAGIFVTPFPIVSVIPLPLFPAFKNTLLFAVKSATPRPFNESSEL